MSRLLAAGIGNFKVLLLYSFGAQSLIFNLIIEQIEDQVNSDPDAFVI